MRYPFATLPDYLRPGLRLVLVGINPGVNSVVRGHYFASPWSRFWPAFSRSRLAGPIRQRLGVPALGPEHDAALLDFGIGFTDVVKRPTPNATGLTPADFTEWAPRLRRRLRHYAPLVVGFHGVTAYGNFLEFGRGRRPGPLAPGPQSERLGVSRVFVVPNPSGANAHVSATDLTRWYDRLADFVNAAPDMPAEAAAGISGPRRAGATMWPLDRKESRWDL